MKDSPLLQALPPSPWDLNAGACFQARLCAAGTSAPAISGRSPKAMEDYPQQLQYPEVFELEVVTNVV